LYLSETPMLFTDIETAELIKYAANAFLATKIRFIKEVADLGERVGADVQDVAHGIGLDGRIGRKFLHAGPGFGGSCFPKDCRALIRTAEEAEAPLQIVDTVMRVNEARKRRMAERIEQILGGVRGKTVAALGLTFKPNTDDLRNIYPPEEMRMAELEYHSIGRSAVISEAKSAGEPFAPVPVMR